VALPVAPQPQAVAGIGAGSVRLRFVQVPRHDQIEVTVTVHVVDRDPLDRRDLREIGE